MPEIVKKTLLLVEDDAILAMAEKMALERYGYAVTTVNTGEKAIAAIKTIAGIDLILMDINLGSGIDGTRAADLILKDREIPIVFVSSHSEREIVEKTEKITSYGYVVKDSGITVLDASIKMAFKLFDARESLQKKMEALKATDDRFQLAMNELDGTLWTLDTSLRFTLSRGRGLASLGLRPDQVIGMSLADYLRTTDPGNPSLVAHRRALLGESVNFEYSLDGMTFRTAVSPLKDMDGQIIGVAGIGTDITQRKKYEEALLRSEEKFSKIFKGSPYPVMIIDTDDGCFAEVNEAMVRNSEYSREELIGENAVELGILPPDSELQTRKAIAESGQFSDLEISIRTKSGKSRIGRASGQMIEIDNHAYLIQTVIDITERKKAEQAMIESEMKYRSIIESSSDAIFCVDERGEYQFTNHLFASTFGKTADYFIGKTFWDVYPKEHADYRFETTKRVFQTGMSESIEVQVPLPDRMLYFYATANPIKDETGKVILSLTHAVDITDRKRAEAALQDSESKLKSYFNESIVSIVLVAMNKHFIDCNEAFCGFTGYSKDEILAKTIADITYREDLAIGDRELKKLAEGTIPSSIIEKRYVSKSGALLWGEINICLIKNAQDESSYFLGTIVDITRRKRAEEEIRALLAEKELILKEVHHRMKNNMHTISSLLSLQAQTLKEPSAIAALEDAKMRINSLMILYEKLYQSSSLMMISARDYLPALVDEVISNFPNRAMVKVETDIQDFMLDAKQLQPIGIIINEFLTNVMKYAFKGREKGRIAVSATNTQGHIAISVKDDGNGIPESVNLADSTGFGLKLVEALTGQLGGTSRIERGSGTTAIVEFDEHY